MKLSTAWSGYIFHAEARGLSQYTIDDYRRTTEKFIAFAGDRNICEFTKDDVEKFLASPTVKELSLKTRLNYHTGLAAIWTWLIKEEVATDHIVRAVDPPDPPDPDITPFSEQDVQLLLANLDRSKMYKRNFQHEPSSHRPPNALRNRAIILALLDTGLRSSELCELRIDDLDLRNREIRVRAGKGRKDRHVHICAKTGKVIWRYLSTRAAAGDGEALYTIGDGLHLSPRGLGLMLSRLGKKAGVRDCYPHRFRHTFALNYLRNGGDAFTLQKLLGHSDMTMTRRYLNLAKQDTAVRHHAASPVANWNI